ncbi:MAG TPA: cytochrome c biogenesis protein ResB [Gammaproteobacteria bacterium]|nr:cytochrome c biogenesis protein ResB [Gammaproteobacteria bacterium]
MNLAITLLVAIAVASVVGTVLQQNQPYQDYLIKFGPFWFDVFKRLGLYNVYGSAWFMAILAFLVLSTSICILRHTPNMLREMRNYRLNVQRRSLASFHLRREWETTMPAAEVQRLLGGWLSARGYRYRTREAEDQRVMAAMKGRFSKLGYFFTHIAIVVICVGALFDGNLPLRLREAAGKLKPETRDLPAAEVPAISRLPVDNPSFRGSVSIPEGSSANVVFLRLREGYLVQPLPFTVEVKDFRIEHYATGQPKSFESDLVIRDPQREAPLERTIAVNHPLIYRGYAIYQSSFSDGGSGLHIAAWPLRPAAGEAQRIEGKVFENSTLQTAQGPMTLEFTDFRLFNINPVPDREGHRRHKNFGPSFSFKLRNATGQAREYENYMSPVEFQGRRYVLTGMRTSPAEPFRYLHIPVDDRGSVQRFLRFNAMLYDGERVRKAAEDATDRSFERLGVNRPEVRGDVVRSMQRLVERFRTGGFGAVAALVDERVPADQREQVTEAYIKVLRTILGELYLELLDTEGVHTGQGAGDAERLFLRDAVAAIDALGAYGSPFYLQLTGYDFVQASGLEITRAPGKNVVYFGFALLTVGVFLMFYVSSRRMWFWIERRNGVTRVLAAGMGSRHPHDFEREFSLLSERLGQHWKVLEGG